LFLIETISAWIERARQREGTIMCARAKFPMFFNAVPPHGFLWSTISFFVPQSR